MKQTSTPEMSHSSSPRVLGNVPVSSSVPVHMPESPAAEFRLHAGRQISEYGNFQADNLLDTEDVMQKQSERYTNYEMTEAMKKKGPPSSCEWTVR